MGDQSNEPATAPTGPRQFEVPRRIEVVRFLAGAGGPGGTVRVRMTTPDARLLQKLTLIAEPGPTFTTAPPALVLFGRGCTVWWKAMERDQVRGNNWIAVNNLLGSSQAVPNSLPEDVALGGSSIEVTTSADAIEAEIVVPVQGAGGIAGSIWAQARFQPAAFRFMPPDEWAEIIAQSKIGLIGRSDPLVVP